MNVFTKFSAFFAAPFLAESLNANLFVMDTSFNNFFGDGIGVNGIYCGDKTEKINNDDITIITVSALKKISKRIENGDFKKINLILCDTEATLEYKWWNDFVRNNKINLFLMPDLEPYCSVEYKPICHFLKINENLKMSKNDKLLITHSPRSGAKLKLKGTNEINKFISDLKKQCDFDFKLINNLSMNDAIIEKSKSHIFVDQLIFKNDKINQKSFGGKIKYNGGLGKSGIEGMLLDCCVITGGIRPNTLPFFEPPPIMWTSYNEFYENLKTLIIDEEKRNEQIKKQNIWVKNVVRNENFYKNYLI